MKKYLLIFCAILCQLVTQAADVASFKQIGQKISVNFELPAYDIEDVQYNGSWEVFSEIKIKGFAPLGHIGKPELPIYLMDFALPEGVESIEAHLVNAEYEEILLDKRLTPFEPITDAGYEFEFDTIAYSTSVSELEKNYIIGEQYVVFAQNGFTFSICPFNYNPISNKLKVLKHGEFVIKYSSKSLTETQAPTNAIRESFLKNSFSNYNEISNTKRTKTYSNCNYLIITPEKYWNGLYGFVKRKSQMGYNFYMATTENIGKDKDAIKKFIQSRYDNESTRPTFVMIVGDIDDVPHYSGKPTADWDPANFNVVSDLGYSLLDGDDLLADVFLGRLSVSSLDELSTYIKKLEYMENNMTTFKRRVLTIAGGEDYCTNFTSKIYSINSNLIRRHWQYDYIDLCEGEADSTTFYNKVKEDKYLMYILYGHGAINHFGSGLAFYSRHFASSNYYPVFIAISCLTGNYGSLRFPACIAEEWIRSPKGGVGYFGGSISTLVSTNNYLLPFIGDYGFEKYDQPGVMCTIGKNKLPKTVDQYKYTMEAYNYFGDPSYGFGAFCQENVVVDNAYISNIKNDEPKLIEANSTILVTGTLQSESGNIFIQAGNEINFKGAMNINNTVFEVKSVGCKD